MAESKFNPGSGNWQNGRSYEAFMETASKCYTVIASASAGAVGVVAPEFSPCRLIPFGDSLSIITMVTPNEAEKLSGNLARAGIEHCFYRQKLRYA